METLKRPVILIGILLIFASCSLLEETFFPDYISESELYVGLSSFPSGMETDYEIKTTETQDGTIIMLDYKRIDGEKMIVLDSSFNLLSEHNIYDGRLFLPTTGTSVSGDIIAGGMYLWQNDYTEASGYAPPSEKYDNMFFFNDGVYNYWVKCESDGMYKSAMVFYRVTDSAYADLEELPENRKISENDQTYTLLNVYQDKINKRIIFVFEDSSSYYICQIQEENFIATTLTPLIESSSFTKISRSEGAWKAFTTKGIILEKNNFGSSSFVVFDMNGTAIDLSGKRVYENCFIDFDIYGNYLYFYDTSLKRIGKVPCWW